MTPSLPTAVSPASPGAFSPAHGRIPSSPGAQVPAAPASSLFQWSNGRRVLVLPAAVTPPPAALVGPSDPPRFAKRSRDLSDEGLVPSGPRPRRARIPPELPPPPAQRGVPPDAKSRRELSRPAYAGASGNGRWEGRVQAFFWSRIQAPSERVATLSRAVWELPTADHWSYTTPAARVELAESLERLRSVHGQLIALTPEVVTRHEFEYLAYVYLKRRLPGPRSLAANACDPMRTAFLDLARKSFGVDLESLQQLVRKSRNPSMDSANPPPRNLRCATAPQLPPGGAMPAGALPVSPDGGACRSRVDAARPSLPAAQGAALAVELPQDGAVGPKPVSLPEPEYLLSPTAADPGGDPVSSSLDPYGFLVPDGLAW